MGVAVAATARNDLGHLLVGDDRSAVADVRDFVAPFRVRELPEEVREFHDVAIGIVEGPIGGRIRHRYFLPCPHCCPEERRRHNNESDTKGALLYREASPFRSCSMYNCAKCPGYCCSYEIIPLTKRDVERLA